MGRTALACALAIVASAAVSYFISHRSLTNAVAAPGATPTVADGNAAIAEQLSAQIAAIDRRLDALQSHPAVPPNRAAVATTNTVDRAQLAGPESADELRAQRALADERWHAYMGEVAQSFLGEQVDPVWANQAAAQITNAFAADEVLREIARDVQCRQQTCRVQIDDSDLTASRRMSSIATRLADVLPAISADHVDQGNGRSTMVLYLSAAGFVQTKHGAK